MKLRDDPVASSAMAGVLTQSNSFKLTGMIGRRPTDSELYMAHFMGVGGAAKLIDERGGQSAGLRRAAVSERGGGQPLDLLRQARAARAASSEVYAELNARYAGAASSSATPDGDGDVRRRAGERRGCERGAARHAPRSTTPTYLSSFPTRDFRASAASRRLAASSDAGNSSQRRRSDLPFAVSGRRARRSRSRQRCTNCGAIRLR